MSLPLSKTDIIKQILVKDTLKDFLNTFETPSIKGYMYELISEFAFVFGQTQINLNDYQMLSGKFDTLEFLSKQSIVSYLNGNAISGNSEGVADIKYLDKNDRIVVISVKYFHEEKDTCSYDVSKMYTIYEDNSMGKQRVLQIICNNKKALTKNFNNAYSSEYKEISKKVKQIYGFEDVKEWYRKLKIFFNSKNLEQIKHFLVNKKYPLELRPHQYIINEKVKQMFNNGVKEILINGIPRCGKTYISGGIIRDVKLFNNRNQNEKIAFITPRPNDCKPGYFKMFEEFSDFLDYELVYLKDDEDYKKHKRECKENEEDDKPIQLKEKSITIFSRHLVIDRQKKIDLEGVSLVILDESHLMCTPYTTMLLNELKNKNIPIIHMTGTSQRVEDTHNLSEDVILRYGLYDVINFKEGNVYNYDKELMEKYMNEKNINKQRVIDMYKSYPDMITYLGNLNIDNQFIDENKQFSWKKLFAMKKSGKFYHRDSVKATMSKIFGLEQECDTSYVKEVLEECDNEAESNVILVFLPFGQGLPVDTLQQSLKKLLKSNEYFDASYECISFSSQSKKHNENILQTIETERKKNSKHLVVLLGSMLELGCSIPNANIVITMHDFTSSDRYIQQIYRCLTENKNKTKGAVIDFNPVRVLYNQTKILKNGNKSLIKKDIIELILNRNMIRIIGNNFEIKKIKQTDIQKIYENTNELDILTNDIYVLSNNIDNNLLLFSSKTDINTGKVDVIENSNKEETDKVKDYKVTKIKKTPEQIQKELEARKKLEAKVNNTLIHLDELKKKDLLNGIKNLLNFSMITMASINDYNGK